MIYDIFFGVSFASWCSLNWIILWSIGSLILLANQDAIPAANLLIGLKANSSSMCVEQLCSEDQLWPSTNGRGHLPRHVNILWQKPWEPLFPWQRPACKWKQTWALYVCFWQKTIRGGFLLTGTRSVLLQRMLKATKSSSVWSSLRSYIKGHFWRAILEFVKADGGFFHKCCGIFQRSTSLS